MWNNFGCCRGAERTPVLKPVFLQKWRDERLGLAVVLASVLVIFVIIAMLFVYQHRETVAQIRAQGASLARVLANVSFSQLSSRTNAYGPLEVVRISQDSEHFAYAVITDVDGRILNVAAAPGISIGSEFQPAAANSWFGERNYRFPTSGLDVLEFHAPIVESGELAGNARIGYRMAGIALHWDQLPFLATLALPIFLLAPFFYFLLRREVKPIQGASEQLATLITEEQLRPFKLEASGELRDFIKKFNKVVQFAQKRIESLEVENSSLVKSQKLLSFGKMRVETVLRALPEAVIILGDDGRVTFANERVETLLGVNPKDILTLRPSEWCTDPDILNCLSKYETAGGKKRFDDTLRLQHVNSSGRRLGLSTYPLFAPKDPNVIFGRLVMIRDVTKEALAEESRANFIAHVAHELKTPLHAIALYAEALQGDQGGDEAFRIEAYNVMHDETERVATLVDNLLSITKIEMGSLQVKKTRVRLRDLLEDAFQHIRHSGHGADLTFELDLPHELSAIAVDKDLLRIAINNLLTNAIKYSNPGGTVRLSAAETDDGIQIRVADNGLGIASEDQAKIFDKFYRSADEAVRQRSGHGLGLPLAKDIVELHRGSLSVTSEPGRGSEFVISLWKDSSLLQQAI
jgi:signal transduction histidine kinase